MPYHHRIHRPPPSAIAFLFVVCMALLASSLVTACTQSQRGDTIRAALISVNVSRDGFVEWDRHHQQALVDAAQSRDAAEDALTAYRKRRQPVADAFTAAYRTLAVAATQTDDLSLQAAISEAGALVSAVRTLIGDLR